MARLARVVLPGVVHHITQRGVRSMNIFSIDGDRMEYLSLLKEQADRVNLQITGYCLMSNHVHLLVIPSSEHSLRRGIGEAHRLYTRYVNFQTKVRGHLFQERFFSCPLDDRHFLAVARYVERNPVRAKICSQADQYEWSSAQFNLGITKDDPIITKRYDGLGHRDDWAKGLMSEPSQLEALRTHFRTGRPLGSEKFLKQAELETGRILIPRKA